MRYDVFGDCNLENLRHKWKISAENGDVVPRKRFFCAISIAYRSPWVKPWQIQHHHYKNAVSFSCIRILDLNACLPCCRCSNSNWQVDHTHWYSLAGFENHMHVETQHVKAGRVQVRAAPARAGNCVILWNENCCKLYECGSDSQKPSAMYLKFWTQAAVRFFVVAT